MEERYIETNEKRMAGIKASNEPCHVLTMSGKSRKSTRSESGPWGDAICNFEYGAGAYS